MWACSWCWFILNNDSKVEATLRAINPITIRTHDCFSYESILNIVKADRSILNIVKQVAFPAVRYRDFIIIRDQRGMWLLLSHLKLHLPYMHTSKSWDSSFLAYLPPQTNFSGTKKMSKVAMIQKRYKCIQGGRYENWDVKLMVLDMITLIACPWEPTFF